MAYDVGKVKPAFNCGALGTRVMISFTLLMSVNETHWKLWCGVGGSYPNSVLCRSK